MSTRIVREYQETNGSSPFSRWFRQLNAEAAVRVTTAVTRLEQGNLSNAKPAGRGVSEYKIDFGPGYRIYFGQDGNVLVILLGGGMKKRQYADIQQAQKRWTDYKARKRVED